MSRTIQVLVTSISRKVPLLAAVKKALHFFGPKSRLIGTDIDPKCIGRYFVDEFLELPPLDLLNKKTLLEICKEKAINAIIPTRDGELAFWSNRRDFLARHGISVMISHPHSIELCRDKYLFYQFLQKHDLHGIPTALSIEEFVCAEYVVKERAGAGARAIGLNLKAQDAANHAKTLESPIFQPYIQGEEFTIDLFLDKTHKVKGCIIRRRDIVINGESQVSTTLQEFHLEKLVVEAAETLKLSGHVTFQAIKQAQTPTFYILECNPRFGGASTLSVAAGLDSFRWFFHEVLNEALPTFNRSPQELRLIRHAEDTIVRL